jgi:hypothetical protein
MYTFLEAGKGCVVRVVDFMVPSFPPKQQTAPVRRRRAGETGAV